MFCFVFAIEYIFYLLLQWLNIFHLRECILRLNLDWPEIPAWSTKKKNVEKYKTGKIDSQNASVLNVLSKSYNTQSLNSS